MGPRRTGRRRPRPRQSRGASLGRAGDGVGAQVDAIGMAPMIGLRLRRSGGSGRTDAIAASGAPTRPARWPSDADGGSRSQSSAASRSSTQNGLPSTATFGPDTIFIGMEARSIPVQISTRGSWSIALAASSGQLHELSAVDDEGVRPLAEGRSRHELVGRQHLGLGQQLGEELSHPGLAIADPDHSGHADHAARPMPSLRRRMQTATRVVFRA